MMLHSQSMSTKLSKQELGMLLFLTSEVMFFAGLISAYMVLVSSFVVWPPADQPRFPVYLTGINTVILLFSGYSLHKASVTFFQKSQKYFRWYQSAVFFGVIFLSIQGVEWAKLMNFGLATTNSVYAGTFYMIIGAHAFHVICGLIYLISRLKYLSGTEFSPHQGIVIKTCRLYWIFVVGVWPILYLMVYF